MSTAENFRQILNTNTSPEEFKTYTVEKYIEESVSNNIPPAQCKSMAICKYESDIMFTAGDENSRGFKAWLFDQQEQELITRYWNNEVCYLVNHESTEDYMAIGSLGLEPFVNMELFRIFKDIDSALEYLKKKCQRGGSPTAVLIEAQNIPKHRFENDAEYIVRKRKFSDSNRSRSIRLLQSYHKRRAKMTEVKRIMQRPKNLQKSNTVFRQQKLDTVARQLNIAATKLCTYKKQYYTLIGGWDC